MGRVTDPFATLFADIGQDYDFPLHNPEVRPDGVKYFGNVPFATPWGFRPLMLDVQVPTGPGPHPLIIYIHGGAFAIGAPTITNSVYRKMDFINRFLRADFAVARISYRFSNEAKFPTQLHDCKSAIRFLRHHAATLNLNPNKFGVIGDSAGGHLASLVALTSHIKRLEGKVGVVEGSSAVSCAINWFGPAEFLTMDKHKSKLKSWGKSNTADSPESLLVGGAIQRNKPKAIAASPVTYAHKAAPPILLQYGDQDRLVPFEQGQVLYEALKSKGADVTLQRIPGADHCFWGVENDYIVDDDITFFKKHLS